MGSVLGSAPAGAAAAGSERWGRSGVWPVGLRRQSRTRAGAGAVAGRWAEPVRAGRRPTQVALDRAGLGKGGNDFHVTAADGALGDVNSKDSPEEVGPGQAVPALGRGGLRMRTGVRFAGLFFRARYDSCPIGGVGSQHTVIAHQVEAPWRYQGGQFLDQFLRRKLLSDCCCRSCARTMCARRSRYCLTAPRTRFSM